MAVLDHGMEWNVVVVCFIFCSTVNSLCAQCLLSINTRMRKWIRSIQRLTPLILHSGFQEVSPSCLGMQGDFDESPACHKRGSHRQPAIHTTHSHLRTILESQWARLPAEIPHWHREKVPTAQRTAWDLIPWPSCRPATELTGAAPSGSEWQNATMSLEKLVLWKQLNMNTLCCVRGWGSASDN